MLESNIKTKLIELSYSSIVVRFFLIIRTLEEFTSPICDHDCNFHFVINNVINYYTTIKTLVLTVTLMITEIRDSHTCLYLKQFLTCQ
jgi:hypothetical protein